MRSPARDIRSFEPVTSIFEELVINTRILDRVSCANVALSDHKGSLQLFLVDGNSSITSAYPSDITSQKSVIVPMVTGDEWCADMGIMHVDLLKIDVEGHEGAVLRGFQGMIERAEIDVIQFEFNTWAIASRALLKDLYELLTPFGYQVGKLYPGRIDFAPYSADLEMFRRSNRVAVRGALVSTLRT